MAAPTATAEWTWPPDVLAFAAAHDLTPYLEPVLEMTRRLFPGRRLMAEVTADYEIPDECYVTIWVEVPDLTTEQLLTTQDQWYDELRRQCGLEDAYWFYLGMHGGHRP